MPSSSTTIREHRFARALFSQWYKQRGKHSLCLPYLNLRGGFSSARSPEGRTDALGLGTTNERPLRTAGSQHHPRGEGEQRRRVRNGSWQPAHKQTIILSLALNGSGAFQSMLWHSRRFQSPDPPDFNRSEAPKYIWPQLHSILPDAQSERLRGCSRPARRSHLCFHSRPSPASGTPGAHRRPPEPPGRCFLAGTSPSLAKKWETAGLRRSRGARRSLSVKGLLPTPG